MTKQELVWLLIRLAGVYFVYLTVLTFFTMIGSGWGLIFAPPKLDIPNNGSNRAAAAVPGIPPAPYDPNVNQANEMPNAAAGQLKPEDKARREAVMDLVGAAVLILIYGAIGYYFLRDGRLLFALLMREDSENPKLPEPEVTTLNL